MLEPDVPELPVIDLTEVKVDIDVLNDFMKVLSAEIAENLQPYSNEIISDHREGVPIGQNSASVPLEALRRQYYMAQQSAVEGLLSYVEATKVLLRAVELMAEHYRHTDAMAQARAIDVMGAISEAQREVDEHKAAIQRAEDHREQHRMYS
jgi:hypothetical protein